LESCALNIIHKAPLALPLKFLDGVTDQVGLGVDSGEVVSRQGQQHSSYSLANKATRTHAEPQFLNLVFRRKSGISEGFRQPRCFIY
jgi:hypothetical protein